MLKHGPALHHPSAAASALGCCCCPPALGCWEPVCVPQGGGTRSPTAPTSSPTARGRAWGSRGCGRCW